MNRERLIADAKARRSSACARGITSRRRAWRYRWAAHRWAALKLGVHLAWRAGRSVDHDALIGPQAGAHFCRRGAAPRDNRERAVHLLDLEREAFLSLCGERKTLERIQYTLKTGKPLRN